MRIELRDGQWADMREHISHAQDKEIIRAGRRVRDGGDILDEYLPLLMRLFITQWHVVEPDDGRLIDIEDLDAFDRAPKDVIDVLFGHAVSLYSGATVPNPPTPPSSDSETSDKP